MQELGTRQWQERRAAHEARVDVLVGPHLARRSRGQKHPVEDFLFTYYTLRPARLRRWRPGAGVALLHADGRREQLDVGAYLARRGETVRAVRALLRATASRPPNLGCFALHEWAMVYTRGADGQRRHAAPLRLGAAGTDAVVAGHRIRCSHVDAFRFFTPEAVGRNELHPTRAQVTEFEQPGCLHANMDLYRAAYTLGEAVPSEMVADCFELARDIRALDMRASPYDLRDHGYDPVRIETVEGKAEFQRLQRAFSDRARVLRDRLTEICDRLLPDDVRDGAGAQAEGKVSPLDG